jgi:hypothetical protein
MSEALTDKTLEILELGTGAMGCISPLHLLLLLSIHCDRQ